jgi:hypothetical protein
MVRRHGAALFGHAAVVTQIGWCGSEHVPRAIFTHCGSEIIGADGRRIIAVVRAWGRDRGVDARIAHDGMRISLAPVREQQELGGG